MKKIMRSELINPAILKVMLFVLIVFSDLNKEVLATQDNAQSNTKVLRIVGWDVYADPINKNKTIGYKKFEQAHDVIIDFTPLNNLDEIINAVESNENFDVVIVSNEGIHILNQMSLVKPLDLNKIPNFRNIYPSLKTNKWIKFNNRVYAIPWAWGPTGLLFDTDALSEPISWNILWNPKYKGKISLWDDVSMIWMTALSLGYKNVYNLTRQQLSDVKQKLFELNNQIFTYYSGGEQAIDFIKNNQVILLNSWFDPSARLRKDGRNLKMIIPKEGAVGMFDSYLISSRSKNTNIAYQFINYQIKPDTQHLMVDITGLAPTNSKTKNILNKSDIKALHLDDITYYDQMLLWDVMPRKHLYEEVLKEVHEDLQKNIRASKELELSETEQKWLNLNPNITFTGDPNWLPYEAFMEDGTYIGIVAEHLKLISKMSGLKFEMSPSKTWTESTEKARKGEVDVISETDDSDLKSHLNFTRSYLSNPIVIVMSSKENYVENINNIKNKKIALIKDYGYTAKIRRKYPDISFVTVDDIHDGLISVSTGEVDALLCTLSLCSYTIANLGLNNVRITGKTDFETKLAFGVQKNQPELLSIMSKSINKITHEQQQAILDRWIKNKYIEKINYTLVYQIIAVAIILIIFFFLWNRRLAQEILLRKITENELENHREHLEEEVEKRTKELTIACDEADRANRGKSEFLSRMSHELRTPMNAILGFSQMLETNIDETLSEEDLSYVNEILSAGYHLLNLINEVLDLSRIESGYFNIIEEDFDLISTMNECITLIEPLTQQLEIKIIFLQNNETLIVHTDRMRIKQIILNLLTNAIKYNRKNGEVELKCKNQDGKVTCSVKDTGYGIPKELQSRVFEPFDRLNADSTHVEGTGIGLSLAKSLIELMNGRIGFSSTEDEGSIFWFEINLSTNNVISEEKSKIGSSYTVAQGDFNILYVEDNPANFRLVSQMLKSQGAITLHGANTASVAMDLIYKNTFNLILLDIILPGEEDGFDILKKLRMNASTREIPVIAISANATEYDIKEGLVAGFDEYITKPIDINDFMESVNKYLMK